ncbi:MAG TPA: anthranilate synthase component I family protein [Gaiellaceae bacterium]|nr:anthranilate synthase component I family protein [Gaiellaceae bacterium]
MEALELRDPAGAFRMLEEWLRERGFFGAGGEGLAAEVYLGYGLSQAIRRGQAAPPPEPCPALPLLACALRPRRGAFQAVAENCSVGAWEPTWTADAYAGAIGRVREAIARGDVYQVNVVQHLSASFTGDPTAPAARLASLKAIHPTPFSGNGWTVVSASPELFLSRRGRALRTMPIKGTRPRGGASELRQSEKDAAEHVMIVDLERNDLSRVCEPGSVRWPELMATRELAGVEHMVSTVEGTLRDGVGLTEILDATFPGGSVTGAPKIAAVDLIAELEPVGRGASMGALGVVRGNGDFDLALTIRTFAIADGRIHLWVGGGVVWDSDPAAEVEESWTKARPLLEAIGSRQPATAGSPR